MQYCTQCGTELGTGVITCPKCGAKQEGPAVQSSAMTGWGNNSVLVIGALLGGAILIVLVVFFLLPRLQTPSAQLNPVNSQSELNMPFPDVPRVSLDDAHAAFLDESVVMLDVRAAQDYAQAHIPGAILIPLDELEAQLDQLPRDREIYTYCT